MERGATDANGGDATTRSTAIPRLPPDDASPGRLLTVPGEVATQLAPADLVDLVADVHPDAIIAVGTDRRVVPSQFTGCETPVFTPGMGMQTNTASAASGQVVIVVPSDLSTVPSSPDDLLANHGLESDASLDGSSPHVVLVTDTVSLRIDPHRRDATVQGGIDYAETLGRQWLGADVTHVSTAIQTGTTTDCQLPEMDTALRIHGCGRAMGSLGASTDDSIPDIGDLRVYPNGAIRTTTHDPERCGLLALQSVGPSRATRLRECGLDDRAAVADTSVDALATIESIGDETAREIHAAARAIAHETVVSTGDHDDRDGFPRGAPVFIDIETDGLAPSTAWLIGVLDGEAETGTYMSFRQRDPENPAAHLEAFLTWLTGSAAGRPVVAWNGLTFDFPVLRERIVDHCPTYLDDWEDRYLFDPLHWARERGNAALPGRTNQLESVASALGWTPSTTGVDGETVAAIYSGWRARVREAETTPGDLDAPVDWERLEGYCEDDVRALATIYDHLETAADQPHAYEDNDATDSDDASRQGSLSDFS